MSHQLPALLPPAHHYIMHIDPSADDWRLDSWEARNVDFSLRYEMRASSSVKTKEKQFQPAGAMLSVCIVRGEQDLQRAAAAGGVPAGDWGSASGSFNFSDALVSEKLCIGGRQTYGVSSTGDTFSASLPLLAKSATGWTMVISNVRPPAADPSRPLEDVTIHASYAQLLTVDESCGKVGDSAAEEIKTNNALREVAAEAASTASACRKRGLRYCDGSATSGRQLDACYVCGGGCFPPACRRDACVETATSPYLLRLRYTRGFNFPPKFGTKAGIVTRDFTFDRAQWRRNVCPSPTGLGVECKPLCSSNSEVMQDCYARRESFKIDSRSLSIPPEPLGPFVFQRGDFTFDVSEAPVSSNSSSIIGGSGVGGSDMTDACSPQAWKGISQRWLLELTCFSSPSLIWRFKREASQETSPSWEADMDVNEKVLRHTGGGVWQHKNYPNETEISGEEGPVIQWDRNGGRMLVNGTTQQILEVLHGLTFMPILSPAERAISGTIFRLLRFKMKLPDPAFVSAKTVCTCNPGWTGRFCNLVAGDLEILLPLAPEQTADNSVPLPQHPGRLPSVFRRGRGTHVAATAVGAAYFGHGKSSDEGRVAGRNLEEYNGAAYGAKLVFFDIGTESPYLRPPTSLSSMYEKAYGEAGARVFLNPWTCRDTTWWDKTHDPTDAAFQVPQYVRELVGKDICNRYTKEAADTDAFVFTHPDMLVIFPAGDISISADDTTSNEYSISAPGTCKNCLTVGVSQSWPEELRKSSESLLMPCRELDCPQLTVDKQETCASDSAKAPFFLPACCSEGYQEETNYRANALHATSSQGGAVDKQAPWIPNSYLGTGQKVGQGQSPGVYRDVEKVSFHRIKPDLVAPGVNIVSARSDGDPFSGGTDGCRCCAKTSPAGGDTACLVAMTGRFR